MHASIPPQTPSPIRLDAAGRWLDVIDQTRLPYELHWIRLSTCDQAAEAIRSMLIRGAPLIGAVAAWGCVFAVHEDSSDAHLQQRIRQLAATRPTAVNLAWALQRMQHRLLGLPPEARLGVAVAEASALCAEDTAQNLAIGKHGLRLLQNIHARTGAPVRVLTHCNAGWLATTGWGTALAPLFLARQAGLPLQVYADETRPRNQGALTAWELAGADIPVLYVADNAGGHLIQQGLVDLVMVGADRVSRQGDVCNKIGTYLKALAAQDCGIPFYAAVPSPTIDWTVQDALQEIPIEERAAAEVAWVQGRTAAGGIMQVQVVPEGVACANPAFDVTPARLVSALITEHGVFPATGTGMAELRAHCQA